MRKPGIRALAGIVAFTLPVLVAVIGVRLGPFDSETGPQICSVGSARAAQLGRFGCCGACCPDHDEQAIVAQADRIDGRDVVPAGC
jgi:hypothetical protein